MAKPRLTIFHHFNPWTPSIGGISTLIRAYIKYTPAQFELRVVGTGGPSDRPGAWQAAEIEGRDFAFMPVFRQAEVNAKPWLPDTLRYALGIAGKPLASDFMHFHRIEPTIVTRRWPGEKTLFVHIDIEEQLSTAKDRSETLWRRSPRAYLALERALVGQFDQVLSCNVASLQFHRRRYPRIADRFKLIRNFFDPDVHYAIDDQAREAARRAAAEELALPADTRFLLFAGRLERMKDPLTLLRAFALLDRPGTHLLVAGEGRMRPEIERLAAELGITQRVSLLGALDAHDLARLQRLCSALVLTSAYEGLPLVVLETLACGTPVVTTPSGDSPRVVTASAGIVSDDFTPGSVAAALARVLDAPERYPSAACVAAARPFDARSVVAEVSAGMLERWSRR